MMIVREMELRDLATLRRIHEQQGFGYELPNLKDDARILSKLVVEGEEGKVIMASLLRLTAEAYLLVDGQADNPAGRWCALQSLHEATRQDAYRKGIIDVQAFIPPEVARRFSKRLSKMGWTRSGYEPWTRNTMTATWPQS